MFKPGTIYRLLTLLIYIFVATETTAQCISNFPYNEGFELNDGNWTVNGLQPDWEWGIPVKPIINKAAGGSSCWVTGTLTGSSYNNGEASWLQSPCFDFSSLQYPIITFKVWWETEIGFDGAGFQYSIDNGASWTSVGSSSSPANCLNSNWFNSQSISYLSFSSSGQGWSGSTLGNRGNCKGGGGSGGWVDASQTIPQLAGQTNVIFRFTFGAGTQCNDYDGFAIDDINISEAPANNGSIAYSCSNSNTVNFSFNTALCPQNYSWDFNDAGSGVNNTSSLPNPVHTFSAPGNYRVTLTVSSDDNAPFSTEQFVSILGVSAEVVTPVSCNGGASGSAKATVTGTINPVNYLWNTIPSQSTATAFNLTEGTYTVQVTSADACPADASVTLGYSAIVVDTTVIQPGCLYEKGKISLVVSGGVPPYNYLWSPALAGNGPTAENLSPGFYSVVVSDNQQCTQELKFVIANLPKPILSAEALTASDCNGLTRGSALATVTGGTQPVTFLWNSNPVQTTPTATNLIQGTYAVTIKDANGCTDSKNITIVQRGICNDVYFSNAFTPEKTQNYLFGPLGNVIEMSDYSLLIYNRFGEQVFKSTDPFIKWDGIYKGKAALAGVYVWVAKYQYKKLFLRNHGTLMLLR